MYVYYKVEHGDQLFKILRQAYGTAEFLSRKNEMVEFVRANNPQISDINRIYPGQIIMLPQDPAPVENTCPATRLPSPISPDAAQKLKPIPEILSKMPPEGFKLASTFGTNALQEVGKGFVGTVEDAITSAIPDLRKVPLAYMRKESGMIGTSQYDYRRRVSIKRLQNRLGFLEPLVFNTKKANEILRVDKNAPNRIHRHIDQLKSFQRIGTLAKYGGRVIKGVDLGVQVTKYVTAEKREDRIGIIADYAGSVAAGLVFIAVVGTPAGWVGLAAVAIGSAAVSATAGALSETVAEGLLADNWKNPVSQFLD